MWLSKSCSAIFLYFSLTGAQTDDLSLPTEDADYNDDGVYDSAEFNSEPAAFTGCTAENALISVSKVDNLIF